jgi:hypothetical protein
MKTTWVGVTLTVLALAACDKPDPNKKESVGSNPLNAPTDYLGAAAKAKKFSEKNIELASLKQAVQQFYAGEGRYPKDLQEAVKEGYLTKIPPAPVGMKITYEASTGEVKIVAE